MRDVLTVCFFVYVALGVLLALVQSPRDVLKVLILLYGVVAAVVVAPFALVVCMVGVLVQLFLQGRATVRRLWKRHRPRRSLRIVVCGVLLRR